MVRLNGFTFMAFPITLTASMRASSKPMQALLGESAYETWLVTAAPLVGIHKKIRWIVRHIECVKIKACPIVSVFEPACGLRTSILFRVSRFGSIYQFHVTVHSKVKSVLREW